MPTKKQRRRREKSHRHEYEYVYVDETGEEVGVDERPDSAPRRRERTPSATTRGGRTIEPPSWQRTLKRAPLFVLLMFGMVFLLPGNQTTAQKVAQGMFLVLIFLPFSYVMDALVYRVYRKRLAKQGREP
jgi:hypothetical protein